MKIVPNFGQNSVRFRSILPYSQAVQTKSCLFDGIWGSSFETRLNLDFGVTRVTTFFVRPLESTWGFQNIAEVNIMDIAINPSINLYAQLAIVAENGPKQTRPSFSAGAFRPSYSMVFLYKSCHSRYAKVLRSWFRSCFKWGASYAKIRFRQNFYCGSRKLI